jgi:hypothetical protein
MFIRRRQAVKGCFLSFAPGGGGSRLAVPVQRAPVNRDRAGIACHKFGCDSCFDGAAAEPFNPQQAARLGQLSGRKTRSGSNRAVRSFRCSHG